MKFFYSNIYKIGLLFLMLATLATSGFSQQVMDEVPQLAAVDVFEHLGEQLPLELNFTNEAGQAVKLGDYFDSEQPVILIMGYYECPMLCNLVLNGLTKTVYDLDIKAGEKYKIVFVSINPEESYELAAAKKKSYMNDADYPANEIGWNFLVASEPQSKALAEAIGFGYRYDEAIEQYAHPAVLTLASGDGKITRYLYGIEYKTNDLKLALLEASEGKIGNTIDRLILYCFHYDPDANGYVVFAGNLMRLVGLLTLIALSLMVAILFYREKHKKSRTTLSAVN